MATTKHGSNFVIFAALAAISGIAVAKVVVAAISGSSSDADELRAAMPMLSSYIRPEPGEDAATLHPVEDAAGG